jgi:hypothetical protein
MSAPDAVPPTDVGPHPLLHIGYQKTGSTTLQQHYFNRLRERTFVTYYGPAGDAVFKTLIEHLRAAPDRDFLAATVREYLRERRARGPGPLVVSDENLAGQLWDRGVPPAAIADRLAAVLPDASVLCCVREQGSRLRSLYSLYVKQGGCGSFDRYLTDAAPGYRVDLDRMEYDTLVAHYRERFGPDRVHVVAYEQWQVDPAAFFASLTALIGEAPPDFVDPRSLPTVNRALSKPSRWVLRQSNRSVRRSRFNARPTLVPIASAGALREQLERIDRRLLPRVSTALRPADESVIAELRLRFSASNARLAALTGLPLRDLGYALPD